MTLTTAEAAAVLAAAQRFDNRQWDDDTARAWALASTAEVHLMGALEAVVAHYSRTPAWIMPSHINDHARAQAAARRDRIHTAGLVDYPRDLTHTQERDYRLAWQDFIGGGLDIQQAYAAADQQFGVDRTIHVIPAPAEVRALLPRQLLESMGQPKDIA